MKAECNARSQCHQRREFAELAGPSIIVLDRSWWLIQGAPDSYVIHEQLVAVVSHCPWCGRPLGVLE